MSERAIYVIPPFVAMAAALAIADSRRLLLAAFYVGGSVVIGAAMTLVRSRTREPVAAPRRNRLVVTAMLIGWLFLGAWAFAAVLDDTLAAGLAFVATIFTGIETLPALAGFGSRVRS